ncbi:MAG: MFS transporter [Lachnospiraceae bacterium]|nr:MFS transporter [Lachnospiraceae bacterium]
MKNRKEKMARVYPNDPRTLIGFSTVSWLQGFATVVFSLFMQYLTDYSGIDEAVGQVGYAAAFGTAILLLTRIVDAIDDPLQAWIMDSAKENRFGKYRSFTLISIFLIAVGIVMMFTLPESVRSSKALLWVWVVIGYLLFEMGSAFNGIYAIIQKATTDAGLRTKIMSLLRMAIILSVIPASFFIPIATAANAWFHNMGRSFTVCMVVITVFSMAISLAGVALIREPYYGAGGDQIRDEEGTKLHLKDVAYMLRSNRPLWAHNIAYFFCNASYPICTAILVYFLKWYYCADLATGIVDNAQYAAIYGMYGAIGLLPALLTPLLAAPFIKLFKTIDRAQRACLVMILFGYGLLFVLYITGILKLSPVIFLVVMFFIAIPSNISTIPSQLLGTEVADYAEYTTGKNMTAMTTAIQNMLQKADNALAAVIPGLILIAVGYSVNAQTGNYAGDLSQLPGMVRRLSLVFTLVPAITTLIGWAIYKWGYNITPSFREEMTEELDQRHAKATKEN